MATLHSTHALPAIDTDGLRVFRTAAALACVLTAWLAAAPCAYALHLQSDPPPPDRGIAPALSVSVALGPTSSGPAADLERAMRTSGFNQPQPCIFFCTGFVPHPFSTTGFGDSGFPWSVGVHAAISRRFLLGVVAGRSDIGTTFGYREPSTSLIIDYGTTIVAPIVSFQPASLVRAGIGPALYWTRFEQTESIGMRSSIERRTGVLVDVSVSTPARAHIFGEFVVQYRAIGTIDPGTFLATPISGESATPFAPGRVRFDHWFVGAGVGVRIPRQ